MTEPRRPADDDTDLRRAYRAAMARTAAGHLDERIWERLACGELRDEERIGAMDHITRCAECGDVWKAIRQVAANAATFDTEAPGLAPARPPRIVWRPLASAAAALLLLASGFVLGRRVAPPGAAHIAPPGAAPGSATIDRARADEPVRIESNVAVIDLTADPTRSPASGVRHTSLPASASLVTFVLALSDPAATAYTLAITRDGSGEIGRASGVVPTKEGTVTVAVPATLLRPGRYSLVLRATSGQRETPYGLVIER